MQIYIRDKVLCECVILVKKPTQGTGQKKVISCLNTTPKSVVAFVMASVLIFIMYKLYMYLRKHGNNTTRPRIEPKVLGKTPPPPELSNQGNAVKT